MQRHRKPRSDDAELRQRHGNHEEMGAAGATETALEQPLGGLRMHRDGDEEGAMQSTRPIAAIERLSLPKTLASSRYSSLLDLDPRKHGESCCRDTKS